MIVFIVIVVIIVAIIILYSIICLCINCKADYNLQTALELDKIEVTKIPIQDDIKIVFLAPVRNAMEGLPYTLETFRKVKTIFPNTRCVFIENDSTDGTQEFIQNCMSKILDTVIIDGDPILRRENEINDERIGRSCGRISRMVALRNELLNHVKPDDDIIITFDADWPSCVKIQEFTKAVNYLLSNPEVNGVVPLFLKHHQMFPFIDFYYDTFAYKDDTTETLSSPEKDYKLLTKWLWPNIEYINVKSAFGTMALYKTHSSDIKYETRITLENQCECEHVSYNEQIGNIRLLPWFQIVI